MKALLINPPQRYYQRSLEFNSYIPIGLLSIASLARRVCEVKVLDCLIEGFAEQKSGAATLYGMPFSRIEERIREYKPDVVGITTPFCTQASLALEVAEICKKVNPAAPVVFGGPDASVRYAYFLGQAPGDFCVLGEGEYAFSDLLQSLKSGSSFEHIKGLAFKKDGRLYCNPQEPIANLDELPLPAYDLIAPEDYFRSPYFYRNRSLINERSLSMVTSRGCPNNCIFCTIHLHMGRRYRAHSPEYVFNHLQYCVDNYRVRNFHFEDDNLIYDKERFHAVLDRITGAGLKIRWDTPNGVDVTRLDLDLLKKMKKTGCRRLTIAIESGNQEILREVINKNLSIEHALRVAQWCKQLRLNLTAAYVIGFPGETLKDMRQTMELALSLYERYDVQPWLQFVAPFYGTRLFELCREKGFIPDELTEEDLACACQVWGDPLITTPDFSRQDLDSLREGYIAAKRRVSLKYYARHPFFTLGRLVKKPRYGNTPLKDIPAMLYKNL
ncbi:MAG: radical SAM protein [Candidatus Omnitrophica bacterium]|nr:radical SAM protein [Candidatus Omnitrophota bacterium]